MPVHAVQSTETQTSPQAFLWIPEKANQVKGIVIGMHNMQEEGILEHSLFRAKLRGSGLAEIRICPGQEPLFDPKAGAYVRLTETLRTLAAVSAYTELAEVPLVLLGHSA